MEGHWEDRVLADAAANLIFVGDADAGETLLRFSEITLRYGESWWDGHDDYVYDVHLTITTDPAAVPVLAAAGQRLAAAFGGAVHTFRDAAGEFRRGSLEEFVTLVGEVTVDSERLQQRREKADTGVRALRGAHEPSPD